MSKISTLKNGGMIASLLLVSACATSEPFTVQSGPTPTTYQSPKPVQDVFACMRSAIGKPMMPLRVAVGAVKDYTGKFSNEGSEGGYKITQGGSLMVISALGKLRGQVDIVERFDTAVAEVEVGYSKGQLVRDEDTVRNLTAGMIQGSDYYIVGGITEVNYNIQSGGAELAVAGVGGGARYFVTNVAADLRLVETKSLKVLDTVSLEKHIVGQEIKANTFRFMGTNLVDFNAGSKNQEPIQQGVRSTLELGVLELLATAYKVDFTACRAAAEANFSN